MPAHPFGFSSHVIQNTGLPAQANTNCIWRNHENVISPAVPEKIAKPAKPTYAYESRVLQGIWAAAPYLHNGSVPTLAELLKPAAKRVSSFKVGPVYDIVNIGISAEQTKFDYTLQTTDGTDRNSGNSRCGHEFGTTLSSDEKKALLESLKTL